MSDSDSESEEDSNIIIYTKDEEQNKYNKLTEIIILNEFKEKIGYIKGVVICLDKAYSLSLEEIEEVLSYKDKEAEDEIHDFYEKIIYHKQNKNRIFYITEFFLEKKCRGTGIGSLIISNIKDIINEYVSDNISNIYLMPGPLEKQSNGEIKYIYNKNNKETVNLKNKLFKFYCNNGFKKINNTEFLYL